MPFSTARNRMGCVSGMWDSGRSNELLVCATHRLHTIVGSLLGCGRRGRRGLGPRACPTTRLGMFRISDALP